MSKLAHSNDETMMELSMRHFGFTPIRPKQCEAVTPERLYSKPHRCPYEAKWIAPNGMNYCNIHAQKIAPDFYPPVGEK